MIKGRPKRRLKKRLKIRGVGGAAGTVFWVDPKEDLVGVFMVSTTTYREHYRFLIKTLIYQAIVN